MCRTCDSCAARGWHRLLTEEELSSWRRWQQRVSVKSCVGLEAFARCLAQVALGAEKAKEQGLGSADALLHALRAFDRLQGPPSDAKVVSEPQSKGDSPANEARRHLVACRELENELLSPGPKKSWRS